MVKIAMFTCALDGGVGQMIYNYFSNINLDLFKVDIITQDDSSDMYYNRFQSLGFGIYRIPKKSDSIIENLKQTVRILKENQYDIVHCHMNLTNAFPLFVAYMLGISVRISHSHGTGKKGPFECVLANLTSLFATDYLACGYNAGKYLYGKKKFKIIKNAIDLEKYNFNFDVRDKFRKELDIGKETKVFGHVGRFSEEKNHEFLIEIFQSIHTKESNSLLILIGDGEDKEKIISLVDLKGLKECILFLEKVNNVWDYLQAMDCFILPSKHEGLCMAAIEAQASGLPTILSDTVDPATKLCEDVCFVDLNEKPNIWAEKCVEFSNVKRKNNSSILRNAGYDNKVESKKLEDYYLQFFTKR